jgi:hypothetical protein
MLATNANDEKFLQKRFHIAEIIYNRLIKHCKKQFNKLTHDPRYKDVSGAARTALIREYGLSQFDIIKYSKDLGQKYRNYLDSKTVQCIAKRVYTSVKSVLYKGGKHIHFKRYGTLDTIETDTNINKLQFLGDKIRLNNIYIKVRKKSLDNPYIKEALKAPIKYIRVKRIMFNTGYRYYVKIILEGTPPNKDVERKTGDVGIDIGTSTIAVSSKDGVFLEELAPLSEKYNKQIAVIQRKMDKWIKAESL